MLSVLNKELCRVQSQYYIERANTERHTYLGPDDNPGELGSIDGGKRLHRASREGSELKTNLLASILNLILDQAPLRKETSVCHTASTVYGFPTQPSEFYAIIVHLDCCEPLRRSLTGGGEL